MWSAWRKRSVLYVGRGQVLVGPRQGLVVPRPGPAGQAQGLVGPAHALAAAALEQHASEAGAELDVAERVARESKSGAFDVLLGSAWVALHAVPRVGGVWRAAERTRAALGLARLDATAWHGVTIDPSPQSSAWLLLAIRRDRYEALRAWRSRCGKRVASIGAYSAAAMSALAAPRDRPQLAAVPEQDDLVWSVATAKSLIAAGQVRGVGARHDEGVAREVDRVAMAHGVAPGDRHVLGWFAQRVALVERGGPTRDVAAAAACT